MYKMSSFKDKFSDFMYPMGFKFSKFVQSLNKRLGIEPNSKWGQTAVHFGRLGTVEMFGQIISV